jgi:hypothetical protein
LAGGGDDDDTSSEDDPARPLASRRRKAAAVTAAAAVPGAATTAALAAATPTASTAAAAAAVAAAAAATNTTTPRRRPPSLRTRSSTSRTPPPLDVSSDSVHCNALTQSSTVSYAFSCHTIDTCGEEQDVVGRRDGTAKLLLNDDDAAAATMTSFERDRSMTTTSTISIYKRINVVIFLRVGGALLRECIQTGQTYWRGFLLAMMLP